MNVSSLSSDKPKFLHYVRDIWQLQAHALSRSLQQDQVALFSLWKHSMQAKIMEIGKKEPQKASLISRTLIFYQNTTREREALRKLGIEVPNILIRRGLPGGMLGGVEGEAAGLIIGMVKGAVQLLVEGNKKEMQKALQNLFVAAQVQLPNGEWVQGYHEGGRILSKPTRSITNYWIKHYHPLACGAGKFISDQVKYEGDFFNNLFHDLTGEARYFIWNDIRYVGCFERGKRSGHGSLEKYSQEERQFYLYYQGTWREDQVETGVFFSPQGEKIAAVSRGVIQHCDSEAILRRASQDKDPASKPPSLTRQHTIFFDSKIPLEEACPFIAKQLSNPHTEFSLEERASFLTTCIQHGKEHAKKIEGMEAIIVIGSSGGGKSTLVNYLAGCTMELKSPGKFGLPGLEEIVVVRPERAGGALDEMMPINYTGALTNLVPQIKTAPDQLTYCDCPGLFGNHREEINIANAFNIRNTITKAKSIKVIIPISYRKLVADREQGIYEILRICSSLFGHMENLDRYHNSLLLGITQLPPGATLKEVKKWLVKDTPPIMHTLSQGLFIFDPLDRPMKGSWDRATCLSQIQALPQIEHPAAICKTVLAENDEKKLFALCEQMGKEFKRALENKQYTIASSILKHLQSLSLAEYTPLERVLDQSLTHMRHHFQHMIDAFRECCNFEHLFSAENLLQELKAALEIFGELLEQVIDLQWLNTYYEETRARYYERKERESFQEDRLKKAQGHIEELSQLLEEQRQNALEHICVQEERFRQMQSAMEERLQDIQSYCLRMEETLMREKKEQLAKKEEELFYLSHSIHQKKRQMDIAEAKQRLEGTYHQKMEQVETERKTLLEEQTAQNEQREKTIIAERVKLQGQLQSIEAGQAQMVSALPPKQLSLFAFDSDEWRKYFGEVREEPPLPQHIEEILNGPCPFWPEKKVKDTHMLVLIPQYINGKPFHLDVLSKLIENPLKGYRTRYDYYDSVVQSKLGGQSLDTHWVLMTRDVIPDSRNRAWEEQKSLVQRYAEQSNAPYELPKTLEAATAILMEHVKTGARLYSNKPRTYTRCQEGVNENRWPTAVGGFSSGGLLIYYDCYDNVDGVACLRRF